MTLNESIVPQLRDAALEWSGDPAYSVMMSL
jgi:hypothetical protein